MTAPTLVISLFGPLRVEVAGEPVELRGSKPPGVLAMLALDPGTPVHADRLVDGLWDHDATGDVHQSLRVHVSVIRRALDAAVPGARHHLAGRTPLYELVDATTDVLLARGERSHAAEVIGDDPAAAVALLRSASRRTKGDPLPTLRALPFVTWAMGPLEALVGALGDELASALVLAVGPDAALDEVAELAAAAPLREVRWRLLAEAHRDAGQTRAAIEALDTFERNLRGSIASARASDAVADLRCSLSRPAATRPAAARSAGTRSAAIRPAAIRPAAPREDAGSASELLELLSVHPDGVTLPTISSATRQVPADALAQLRALVAAGVVVDVPGPPVRFRATDPAAIIAALGPAGVMDRSRELLDAMEVGGAPVVEMVPVALAARDLIGPRVGTVLAAAVDVLLAEGCYAEVAELGGHTQRATLDPRARRRLRAAVCYADAARGAATDADLVLLELAQEAGKDGDWESAARALRLRAELGHEFTFDLAEDALLAEAVDAVDEAEPLLRFDLLELSFFASVHAGAGSAHLEQLWHAAEALSRELGLPDRRARASHMAHQVASTRGVAGDVALRISQQTRRFARDAGDRALEAKALADLIADSFDLHRLSEAEAYCEELVAGPDPHGRWAGSLWRGAFLLDRIDLAGAEAAAAEAAQLAARHGILAASEATVAQQVLAAWVDGSLGELAPLLGGDGWMAPGRTVWGAVGALALGVGGDEVGAGVLAADVAAHIERTGASGWSDPVAHACLVEVAHLIGHPAIAEPAAAALEHRRGGRLAIGSVDFGPVERYLALAAATRGDLDDAGRMLERARRVAAAPLWDLRIAVDAARVTGDDPPAEPAAWGWLVARWWG